MLYVSAQADLTNVCIDSTAVRTRACAADAAIGNVTAEALGRSHGGFGYKTHALVDAPGLPVCFILTGDQGAAITQAMALVTDTGRTGALLADKGC